MYAVVLAANAISDIDYTGVQTLRQVMTELDRQHIRFAIARASHLVHHNLKHGELLHELVPQHLFTSVDHAVTELVRDQQRGTSDRRVE